MESYNEVNAAFARVSAGYVPPAENTHDGAARHWCRLVAQGRLVRRASDGGIFGRYQTKVAIVEHPALPAGEVYALFWFAETGISVYRCRPEDALLAVRHHSAFNL